MRFVTMAAIAIFSLTEAHFAQAQATNPVGQSVEPNAEKLALARDLLEAAGGRAQMEKRLDAVLGQMQSMMEQVAKPGQVNLMSAVYGSMRLETEKHVPELLDNAAHIYAEVYTEQEMRDYAAWLRSPSGRSLTAKSTEVSQRVIASQLPMIKSMLPEITKKAAEHACDETKCSAEDRETLSKAMAKLK